MYAPLEKLRAPQIIILNPELYREMGGVLPLYLLTYLQALPEYNMVDTDENGWFALPQEIITEHIGMTRSEIKKAVLVLLKLQLIERKVMGVLRQTHYRLTVIRDGKKYVRFCDRKQAKSYEQCN